MASFSYVAFDVKHPVLSDLDGILTDASSWCDKAPVKKLLQYSKEFGSGKGFCVTTQIIPNLLSWP